MVSLDERLNTIAFRTIVVDVEFGRPPRFDPTGHVYSIYRRDGLVIKDGRFSHDDTGRHPSLIIEYEGNKVYEDSGFGHKLVHYTPGERWEQVLEDAYYEAWLSERWRRMGPANQFLLRLRIGEIEDSLKAKEKPIKDSPLKDQ